MTEELSRDLNAFHGIEVNCPLYVYQMPMFMLTVSTVVIVENGIVVIEDQGVRFPTTTVRAGRETIEFAAIRNIKEEVGVVLPKGSLIPVDFRSSPERSSEGNVVDIGMVAMPELISVEDCDGKWLPIDFEQKEFMNTSVELLMDHDILMERAIEIALMVRS
jgi:ADP-ribose pyrophosphatase YjhB (NUDIX family)